MNCDQLRNNVQSYTTSIYVVGPSSTGKTTLCEALAKRLNIETSAYVSEVARQVIRTRGFTRENVGMLEMQVAIMEAQLQREREVEEGTCRIRLSDRSAVDPIVYAVLTSKNDEESKKRRQILTDSPQFQRALERYRRSIFVLLTPIPEWLVDDGIRLMDNQMKCLEVFRETLRDMGISYRELGADIRSVAERTSVVMGLARL
jgi:nicotinamide riboside kinase